LVEDLEYHSLALIELSFTLEDEFDLNNIDESVARRITTVGDIEEYVVSEVRNREAAI
jgi:acyl carrier protein